MSHGVQHSIAEVIGEVTRALISAPSKIEIRHQICETFAASEVHSFAWVGRYNPQKEEVSPIAFAGIAEKTLTDSTICEEAPQVELTNDAVQTREVVVGRNLVEEPPCEEWRDHALAHKYQAYAVIPLVYEDTLYGVLHLATTRPQAFGAAERELLAELGVAIAYALETAESSTNSTHTDIEEAEADRARMSAESEQERRLYETIISSTPDLVYAFDLDYRIIFANDALLEMWGISYEESIGKSLLELGYEPWHAEMHEREIDQVMETKEPIRGEVAFEHAEHGRRIYDYIFAPVLNDEGDVEAIAGTTRDITERKEAEEALQESKERFQALVTASSDALYRMSPDWSKMYRLEGQEFIADTEEPTSDWLEKYIHPDDQERVMEAINEAIRTKSVFELEHQVEQVDGSLGWTHSRAVPRLDEDGDIIEWVGMARDITERKAQERKLEESERRYRALVENFPNGSVGLFDENLRYTAVGGELFDNLDFDPGDRIGEEFTELHPPEIIEEVRPYFEAALEGEANTFEIEYADRHLYGNTLPVRDARDEVFAGMLVIQDVTQRQEYQRRLEKSNERLEQFAYAVSHDLQEPLRMVTSYLQLIERRYGEDLDADGREFIDYAVNGATRMREMIDALLEYSRVETEGQPFEPVDLTDVFAEVRDDLQFRIEESGAEISWDSLPTVHGDKHQLREMFQNLLDNAIEYSGDAPPQVHLGAERDGNSWTITVEDNGIGIDQEHQERVFEVFQRLHTHDEHAGTGIGLALVERIVERHGGEIWVESEPGDGATFSFTLPATET